MTKYIYLLFQLFIFQIITEAQNTSSVLSQGNWYKLKITQSGVYKITFDELRSIGFANPENVKVYGNGGAMLSVLNSEPRNNDIAENKFRKANDHILFYAKAPVEWEYNESKEIFEQSLHLYTDTTIVFLTDYNSGNNSNIEELDNSEFPVSKTINVFDDRKFLEVDSLNLKRSGRQWFWKHFKSVTEYDFNFNFDNIVNGTAKLTAVFAAHSGKSSNFIITSATKQQNVVVDKVRIGDHSLLYANTAETTFNVPATNGNIPVHIKYNKTTALSEGWLDYMIANVKSELVLKGNQMHFRSVDAVESNSYSEFKINTAGSDITVWDITDPIQPVEMKTTKTGNYVTFVGNTTTLREYIAFKQSGFLDVDISKKSIEKVENQNLHSYGMVDMIIVSHPLFLEHANELAQLHEKYDQLSSLVVTTEQIYNEFSGGMPDVSAIRDFVKMIYERETETDTLKYLLLFGDGSYNNKTISATNSNYILTYQSEESLDPIFSFVSDDFFGLLENDEGRHIGDLDIGIGRLPVKSTAEADIVMNKIKQYINPENKGTWCNTICFIADDADENQRLHMVDANEIADKIAKNYPYFNIDKIYLDAFPQVVNSSGQSYPEVTRAINNRIKKGTLIVNYTGHGNENKLAHEDIITVDVIQKWDNFDKLPVFVTATCEFSRFDDYDQKNKTSSTSAGELILLNPDGGAIALFTTSRVVYASSNSALNNSFYKFAFEHNHKGEPYRLGDMVRHAKNITSSESNINKRNFSLLGDPALLLAYPELTEPKYKVITEKINGNNTNEKTDTLKAFSQIEIQGYLKDVLNDTPIHDFDGQLFVTVYDKEEINTTLNNDGAGAMIFKTQNNIIYKGTTSIEQGRFSFSFRVPKDITYNFGNGKISYYAKREIENRDDYASLKNIDMSSCFTDFVVGGTNSTVEQDITGPELELFINDTLFVDGGYTHESPVLLAKVFDKNGINTTGSGIGHDITLIIDNDYTNVQVLNDFYSAETNSFQRGSIEFPILNMNEGIHTATLKVWDIFNNSTEKTIRFNVIKSENVSIAKVYNYPNPFSDKTYFMLEHNQAGKKLNVVVRIYSTSGKLMTTLKNELTPDGFRSGFIEWNGCTSGGEQLHNGVYIYRIEATNENGKTDFDTGRLVILR